MRYEIDLSGVYNPDNLHEVIAEVLPLPDYYGGNLDALHDCLTDFRDLTLIIVNSDCGGYFRKLLPVMQDMLQRLREDGFDRVNPSVIKAAIVKEYPTFDEKTIGCKKFSDLLKLLQSEGLMKLGTGPDHSMLVQIL